MMKRLLVANRAEIAGRVFATCRRLGIGCAAVFSDADAGLPFVAEADLAVRLPGEAPADTYLRIDLILAAARSTGSDAIHPGYGFLSENADFARAVIDAGLTWVGPSPESIAAMGSKIEAKRLMEAAGVPVLPNLTEDGAENRATEDDFPLLVKASAGGGGRGMRVVRTPAELPGQIAAARAEAESAFGDGTVFVEPYVERGRHVEVQVVGDRYGDVLVLGERDCSIQRRHQKVVEESPAPNLDDGVRAALHEAARTAATAIDYVGAGTVEFLYDPDRERFWFLEMNTRLQVEHPVTEAVYGVDLVAMQLAVASGGRSSALAGAIAPASALDPRGHAIEVRLYAEDPSADWQPQSGRLDLFEVPHEVAFAPQGAGIRLDAGFATGDEVGTFYDAMLAKVIAVGPDRASAARALAGALDRSRIHGVVTNRGLLVEVLRDPEFLAGEVSTDLLARRGLTALEPAGPPPRAALVAAALMVAADDGDRRTVQRGIPLAWRNVVSAPQRTVLADAAGTEHTVEWYGDRAGPRVDGVRVVALAADEVVLEIRGVRSVWRGAVRGLAGGDRTIDVDGPGVAVRLGVVPRFTDPAAAVASGSLLAPMPGTVVSVAVGEGDVVAAGAPVLVLEAMKMQHTVTAPADGVVGEVRVAPGAQVAAGEVLAVVSTSSTSTGTADAVPVEPVETTSPEVPHEEQT